MLTSMTIELQGNTPPYGARLTQVTKCATDLTSGQGNNLPAYDRLTSHFIPHKQPFSFARVCVSEPRFEE